MCHAFAGSCCGYHRLQQCRSDDRGLGDLWALGVCVLGRSRQTRCLIGNPPRERSDLGIGAFGVGFDCLDASRYSGISFKVSGNPGPSGMLSVAVNTEADTLRELGGTCVAEPSMCLPPSKNIAVDATPTTVSLAWADFAGGMPRATVDPTRVHAVVRSFAYAPASYAADITVDDLAFW